MWLRNAANQGLKDLNFCIGSFFSVALGPMSHYTSRSKLGDENETPTYSVLEAAIAVTNKSTPKEDGDKSGNAVLIFIVACPLLKEPEPAVTFNVVMLAALAVMFNSSAADPDTMSFFQVAIV